MIAGLQFCLCTKVVKVLAILTSQAPALKKKKKKAVIEWEENE